MLLQIREKITGWIAYGIIGIISVPFALWGINFYFQDSGDPIVIEIADQEITLREYRNAYINQKRLLEERIGGELEPEFVRQQTVITLLREGLVAQETERNGYSVSGRTIAEAIARSEQFQTDGRFDKAVFSQFLDANNLSFKQYQSFMRKVLRDRQLQSAVSAGSFTLDAETKLYEDLSFQTRKIRYVDIDPDKWLNVQKVSDEEAQNFYNENREKFKTPRRFKMDYLELKMDDIENGIVITEEEGRNYYASNLQDFIIPERRIVAHLLFSPRRHGEAAAEERAQEAYDRLLAGEDFAELVKEFSDDFLSLDAHGELPPFERDELEEAQGAAIFSLQEGSFSQPINSRFGIQIFKLLSVVPQQQKAYEGELMEAILARLKRDQSQGIYDDKVSMLKELAFENENLSLVADLSELELHKTGWLSEDVENPFLGYKTFRTEINKEKIFSQKLISEVFEIEPRRAFVFQITNNESPRQQSYKKVSEKIFRYLQKRKAGKESAEFAQQIVNELRSGTTFEDIAEKHALEIQDPGFIRRNISGLDQAVINAAYRIPPPKPDQNSYRAAEISEDGYHIVIELSEVKLDEERDEEEIEPFAVFINEVNLVLQDLTQTIDFKINNGELDKFEGE